MSVSNGRNEFDTPAHRRSVLDDRLAWMQLRAPDNFPSDTGMNLERGFQKLFSELAAVRADLKRDVAVADQIKALLEQALEVYRTGDKLGGARFISAAIDLHPTKLR